MKPFYMLIIPFASMIGISLYFQDPDVKTTNFSVEQYGQLGDFIGGILNPAFGLLTVVLLLLSIKEQRNSNEIIKKSEHKAQHKDATISMVDRLIKTHYELLKTPLGIFIEREATPITVGFTNNVSKQKSFESVFQNSFGLDAELFLVYEEYFSCTAGDRDVNEINLPHPVTKMAHLQLRHISREFRNSIRRILDGYEEINKFQDTNFLKFQTCLEWEDFLENCEIRKIINFEEFELEYNKIQNIKDKCV